MLRRLAAAVVVAAAFLAVAAPPAGAHAGLRSSDPAAGSGFDVAPTTIRLTFLEQPEPALATIRVTGAPGTSHASGRPTPVPGDPLTLAVPVLLPDERVYTVTWRVVSAVDGHAAAGVFSFGVGVPADQLPAPAPARADLEVSPLELAGRWAFALGLIAVLGVATAQLAGFGGRPAMARAGLAASAAGLAVLAEAQRRAADSTFGALLDTDVGRSLVWRAVALGGVAAALLLLGPRRSRLAAWASGLAAAGAVAAHVAAGHAYALGKPSVAAQWGHVIAVCMWAGGLSALLVGLREGKRDSATAAATAASVRRFSKLAAPVMGVLIATGVIRAIGGLSAWGDLTSTGYGRTVAVKSVLVIGIVALAYVNRRRGVDAGLRLLRRLAGAELVLATGALGAAALLASLPPPAAVDGVEPLGLKATGVDAATTVRVELTTAFALPGPNRFSVRLTDYDSRRPLAADRVSLEFRALDDPDVAPTTLALDPVTNPRQFYLGRGSNLTLEGRWGVTVLVQRGAQSVTVPLQVQTKSAPQYFTVLAPPGQPKQYTVELVASGGFLRVWADPQRGGASQVFATFFDWFGEPQPVGDPVLTVGSAAAARQETVRRLDSNRFVADVSLPAGKVPVAVVARTRDGDLRLRATVTLEIPKD